MKTLNSNSLSAKFIFQSHNWHWTIANSQLRKRSYSSSQFPLWPPPSPNLFLRSVYWGEYFPKSAIFGGQQMIFPVFPRRDRPTRLPLFANVVSLPLEFRSQSKMRLTSLHDSYGSRHLYICRSLIRSLDLFDASLLFVKGTSCCAILRNFR